MKAPFEIRYLKTAEKDLDDIFTYIMKDEPGAAITLLDKFELSISQLSFNPELGVVPKNERLKRVGYRVLIVGKYLILYVIKKKTVQVRRVIHGARQYDFLL